MQRRLLLSLFLAVSCFATGPARADQLTPEKKVAINRLLDMTGAMAIGVQLVDFMAAQMIDLITKSTPDIPPKLIDAAKSEVRATFIEGLPAFREQLISIYSQHFTLAEVNALIGFYGSEIGKKTIQVMPMLMRDGQIAGQKWGQSLEPALKERLSRRFKKEGFEDKAQNE
jgi:hypothetical protein